MARQQHGVRLAVLVVVLAAVGWAAAELADVYLKNGLRLRGDVTTGTDELVIRNAAGEFRVPRAQVARLVPVPLPATAPPLPTTAPAVEDEPEPEEEPVELEPGRPEALPPAPAVSDDVIQRLRLHELILEPPAEFVQVRFEKRGRQRDLPLEVLDELRRRPDFQPAWEETLTRGQPHERLQLIVRETGAQHIERIDIATDPEVFRIFRQRILPIVTASCARGGCHSGSSARVFRFPVGSKKGDAYAYTTFVLLDQMETPAGPMLDRDNPTRSGLVRYLLPPEFVEHGHPPVGRGPSFKPGLRGVEDPKYAEFVNWISFLRMPRPDYGLTYDNPYAGLVGGPPPESLPAEPPPAAPAAETQPTTMPAE